MLVASILPTALTPSALHRKVANMQPQTTSTHITLRGASEWSSEARSEGQAHVGVEHRLTGRPVVCALPLKLVRSHLLVRPAHRNPVDRVLAAGNPGTLLAHPEAVEARVLWKGSIPGAYASQGGSLSPRESKPIDEVLLHRIAEDGRA